MDHTLYRRHLGEHFSEGSRRLWLEIRKRRWTQVKLGYALGNPSPGTINRWLYGDRRPALTSTLLIQKVLKIDARLWNEPPRRSFVPPAARKAA